MSEKKSSKKGATKKVTTEKKSEVKKKPVAEKKQSKKTLVIVLAVVAVILVAGIGFLVWYLTASSARSLGADWAETYYEYIKTGDKTAVTEDEGFEPSEVEVGFLETSADATPIMLMNRTNGDETHVSYLYQTDGRVGRVDYGGNSKIELLYNIELAQYIYYVVIAVENETYYYNIEDSAESRIENEIVIGDNEKTTVKDADGKEISLSKFDETFVKTGAEIETTTIPADYGDGELRDAMREEVSDYQPLAEAEEAAAEQVEERLDWLEGKQAEMKEAEDAAKAKAEAEAKAKAEEAKKSLKLDGKTLAYGTYRWNPDEFFNSTLVINNDGTCLYDQEPCTWSTGSHDYAQDVSGAGKYVHESLIIHTSDGYSRHLFPIANNELSDGDLEWYKYIGS